MSHVCKGLAAIWAYSVCSVSCLPLSHSAPFDVGQTSNQHWINISCLLGRRYTYPPYTIFITFIITFMARKRQPTAMRHAGDVIDLVSSV